jgi:hypothetical protein
MPFPLPETSVDNVINLYGQFDDAELAAIVSTNQCMLDEADPIHHLLALREQPYLKHFEQDLDVVQEATGYRSAVCLGATMLRRFDDEAHLGLSELRVNPARSYLFFADAPVDEAYRRYGSWPIMTEDFTDPKHYSRFFEEASSVHHLRDLRDTLVSNHIGFLEGMSPGQQVTEFGYFCRGLLDTFALYAQLRYELRVAPPNQVYDAEKHQLLDVPGVGAAADTSDLALRWRVGGVNMLRPKGDDYERHNQMGTTAVPYRATLSNLYRGIAGYVRESDESDSPTIPILFRGSKETFDFKWTDALIMRNTRYNDDGTTSSVFHTEKGGCPPFVRYDGIYPQAEVVGHARHGQIKFLYDPPIDLDKEESTLAQAVLRADEHPGYKNRPPVENS